jgi:Tfp pilus assembly protein PilV
MNMTTNASRTRRSQRGFSIIEALIAGLVLSFGMLALVGVQVTLSRNADVAKQRTEATRLAQQRMELLRAYSSVAADANLTAYGNIANGSDAANTVLNTVFDRSWTVTQGPGDTDRRITVTVAWTDRANQRQSVVLSSVIAQTNLRKVGLIMANVDRAGDGYTGPTRQRNANVPYPAQNIGNNRSTYRWPGTSLWYVFDNDNADVLYRCTTRPDANTNLDVSCTTVRGYVVAGYISVNPGNGNNGSTTIDTNLSPWLINGCSIGSQVNIDAVSCFVENMIVGSSVNPACPYISSGNTISGSEVNRLRFYKCYAALVEVSNPDNGWGGRMTFAAAPTGDDKICRYPHVDTNTAGSYVNVETSLNNENYFARTSGNCTPSLIQHQPQP